MQAENHTVLGSILYTEPTITSTAAPSIYKSMRYAKISMPGSKPLKIGLEQRITSPSINKAQYSETHLIEEILVVQADEKIKRCFHQRIHCSRLSTLYEA
ncbi:hypothetical protein AF72_11565 [Xylella taiwanensis]|uniref:Uncharacterized protein n=1 Tax=Xylella taiwanensis TaxID=1444770 RepID=Z9JH25_9GAMM|nr:hypothetical protein AF72_11565 [Xylella taiwanensis]